jgi:hypothetical protein
MRHSSWIVVLIALLGTSACGARNLEQGRAS